MGTNFFKNGHRHAESVSSFSRNLDAQYSIPKWQIYRTTLLFFKQEMHLHSHLTFGFGLFWAWVWLIFQTTFYNPQFILLSTFNFPLPGWVIPLSTYAITFFILGFGFKLKGIIPYSDLYRKAIPAAMSGGVAIYGILTFSPLTVSLINAIFVYLSGLLMGIGTACCHMEWGRAFGNLGSRITILHTATGTIVAALLIVLIALFPAGIMYIIAFFFLL